MNSLLRVRRNSFHLAWTSLLVPPLLIFAFSSHRDPLMAGLLMLLQITPLVGLIVFLAGWFRNDDAPHIRRIANEFRAQVPGAFIAIGVPGLLFPFQDREVNTWAFVFYVLGCALMGATAFGAEFEQKTIGGLLAQPFRRSSIYREKMIVLGSLLALALLETFFGLVASPPQGDVLEIAMLLAVPVLALCTGPMLSLRTRGTLTGMVLSVAAPMLLVGLGHVVLALLRLLPRNAEDVPAPWEYLETWGYVMLPLYAVVCAWYGWRTFLKLEIRDSMAAGTEFNPFAGTIDRILQIVMPHRGSGGSSMLWRKEFRLHVVPWMISALMVGVWILLLIGRSLSERIRLETAISYEDGFVFIATLLGGATLLLAGAASIAEERQMGVLDWQLTTPASVRRQWWIKVAVTYVVAITLGALLPSALLAIALGRDWVAYWINHTIAGEELQVMACFNIGLLLVAISMYGSSLSRNTVKAVGATIAIFLIGFVTVVVIAGISGELLRHRYAELRELQQGSQLPLDAAWSPISSEQLMKWVAVLLPLPMISVWLIAAGRNFRFGLPDSAAVRRQLGVLTLITLAILAVFVFAALFYVEWAGRTDTSGTVQ